MKKQQIDAQIQERVQAFVADLTELIHSSAIAAVQEAIAGAGLAGPPRAGAGRRTTKKRAAKKRTAKKRATARASKKAATRRRTAKKRGRSAAASPATMRKVVDYLGSHPDQGVADIAAGLGVKSASLKASVAQLLEDGTLGKKGQRRGTRYFLKK